MNYTESGRRFPRRRFLKVAGSAALVAAHSSEFYEIAAAALESPLARNPLARKLLQMSDPQLEKLEQARQKGLMELAPVNLPTPDRYSGDNDHFGWPVATMIDDTLIVCHRRNLGHKKAPDQEQDQTSSYSVVVWSADGGKSWSEPYDLRDCIKPEDRNRGGFTPLSHRYKFNPKQDPYLGYKLHLIAIGTTKDGGVVVISDHGAFRSDNKGKTWKHFSKAFREDTMEGPILYTAQRLFEHPEYGLVLLAHSMPNRYPHHMQHPGPLSIADTLYIRYSQDGGETWKSLDVPMPKWAKPNEPCPLYWNGKLIVLARSWGEPPKDAEGNMHYVQIWSEQGWPPFQVKSTTIRSPKHDTCDLDYNPVTKRLEATHPNRSGAGPGKLRNGKMSLLLWSIDPEELLAGSADWRFDLTFFSREGQLDFQHPKAIDGLHPTGNVIDEKAGVQHIFMYMGFPEGPAGVFRLTRTLDTEKLKAFLTEGGKT